MVCSLQNELVVSVHQLWPQPVSYMDWLAHQAKRMHNLHIRLRIDGTGKMLWPG